MMTTAFEMLFLECDSVVQFVTKSRAYAFNAEDIMLISLDNEKTEVAVILNNGFEIKQVCKTDEEMYGVYTTVHNKMVRHKLSIRK